MLPKLFDNGYNQQNLSENLSVKCRLSSILVKKEVATLILVSHSLCKKKEYSQYSHNA